MTETQDIVERLRTMGFLMPTCAEAADEIERLRGLLPEEMPGCKIEFRECEHGHGRLTAVNWIDHCCQQCEIERLCADLACSELSEAELKQACGDLDLEIERLRDELKDAVAAERERIAAELDNEADMTPCAEDRMVVRNCANLVRADFDYERAEAIATTAEHAHD